MALYFYRDASGDHGPVDGKALKQLVAAGTITPKTLLRRDDQEKWTAAGKSKLFPAAEAADDSAESDEGSNNTLAPFVDGAMSVFSAARGLIPTRKDRPVEIIEFAEPPPVERRLSDTLIKFSADGQKVETLEKLLSKVEGILTDGETIVYIAIQSKPIITLFPDCAVCTNRRFILYRSKILGRMDFDDYLWRELRDCKLEENIFGATISMHVMNGALVSMSHLPKVQARAIYRLCQQEEEAAIEIRRNRRMEESRAAAGGVTVQTNFAPVTAAPAPLVVQPAEDPVAKLGQLKKMLDAGLINAAEFEAKKAEILSRI